MLIDEVLPDRHRVAATPERLDDQLSVRLARARTRRAARAWDRAPSRWTPPPWWPVLPARSRWTPAPKWPVLTGQSRWTPPAGKLPVLPSLRSGALGRAPESPRLSDSRSRSPGAHRSSAGCARASNRDGPVRGSAVVWCRPRRCSCRRQNLRSAPASTSRPCQLIAGFEVSINCRFWVSTEAPTLEVVNPDQWSGVPPGPSRRPPVRTDSAAPSRSDANTMRWPSGVQIRRDSTLGLEASAHERPRPRSKT